MRNGEEKSTCLKLEAETDYLDSPLLGLFPKIGWNISTLSLSTFPSIEPMPPIKANKGTVTHRAAKKEAVLDYDIDKEYQGVTEVDKQKGINQNTSLEQENEKLKGLEQEAEAKTTVVGYYFNQIDEVINTRHVFQIFMLVFLMNLTYLAFKDKELAGDENAMTTMITCGCVLLACGLECFAVLNSKFKNFNEGKSITKPELLDFDYIYSVFFPLIVCTLKSPENIALVACCVAQLNYMNVFVKIMVSYVVLFQFNIEGTIWTTQTLTLPLTNAFFYECINRFIANELPIYEKTFLGLLYTSLTFFITKDSNITLYIMKNLVLSFTIALIFTSPLLDLYRKTQERSMKVSLLVVLYLLFLSLGLIISDKLLLSKLGKFPFNWLVEFINENEARREMFQKWSISSALLVPSVFLFFSKFHASLSIKRKVWHFIIFMMIIPAISREPELVSIALFGMTGVLIFVETLRCNELPPFGKLIKHLFEKYEDSKDNSGKIITSYTYLIAGVALPFWLNNCDATRESSYMGLVVLGLGDAFASLVGGFCGSYTWPQSKKTIEGSLAMFVGIVGGFLCVDYFAGTASPLNWTNRVLCGILCALFEGIVDVNDNLFLPVFAYTVAELLILFN